MKTTTIGRVVAGALVFAIAVGGLRARAQSNSPAEMKRQVKHLVAPQFPDLAKKLNLTGTVRIEVTIGQDGIVKHSRILGGHPVLAAEAERAAEKSTFEPGPKETTEVIEFKF
jgi:TonB family protein